MRAFLRLLDRVRARTGITIVTVTHDIRGLASRAARVVLLGEGRVRADGPANRVFAMTDELARWGVLAPPLARLQSELLGPAADEVMLEVDELASTVLAHRPGPAPTAPGGATAIRRP
jgi:energy-coupling factor transport system ATP-binding protein